MAIHLFPQFTINHYQVLYGTYFWIESQSAMFLSYSETLRESECDTTSYRMGGGSKTSNVFE